MSDPQPKRPRSTGRLGQMNKVLRLHRRHLGQWRTPPNQHRKLSHDFTIPHYSWPSP